MSMEFLSVLESLANEQTYDVILSPRSVLNSNLTVKAKPLTTFQLRRLIETVINNPLDQTNFNTVTANILLESIKESPSVPLHSFDRLLFLIQARINSLSSSIKIKKDEQELNIDLNELIANALNVLTENQNLLEDQVFEEGAITIVSGPSLLKEDITEANISYGAKLDPDDIDQLRDVVGKLFIYEITKGIKSVRVGDAFLDFSQISFEERVKIVEKLPASSVQKLIEYIENLKAIQEKCLTYQDHTLKLDGTLFAMR